ncbi:helix-turn-helix domain-containing protein [Neptunomonas phycophila]|uniref:helix-turn-helix domain-containing protein n=1 Tax=Neptunomonas phycophila TaxID=1572645 RepID=UPI003735DDDC
MNKAAGARLKAARKQAGFTPEAAARAMQRSIYTYRSWERGEKFPSNTEDMVALCALFDMSLDWWIRGIEPNNENALKNIPARIKDPLKLLIERLSK